PCRTSVRAGDPQRRQLARAPVARRDFPVALAAGDLRLLCPNGDPCHRAARHRGRLVLSVDDRCARGDDGRGHGADPQCPPAPVAVEDSAECWGELEASGRVLEFEGLRKGWASARDKALAVPKWLLNEPAVWAGVPLLHHQRLVGLVVLAAPDFRRQLDWED